MCVKSVVDGSTTYYVYSALDGTIILKDESTANKVSEYASAGPLGIRLVNGSPTYVHRNHLGSPVAATNTSGGLLWRETYMPFGETMLSPAGNDDDRGFTGHLADSATGLVYMQARYYDPIIGRFLQTDPVGYADQMNLYAYVANDPINNTDPTGMVLDTIADIGFIIADVVVLAYDEITNGGANRATNLAALGADAAGAVIPFATGGGLAVRAGTKSVDAAAGLSQRAATRQAKREAGIPTSQQAVSQTSHRATDGTKVGRQQTFETPKPGGGTQQKSVQVSRDQIGSHANMPQIEAGKVKPNGQFDSAGRPRIQPKDKVRVDFDPDK